MPLSRGSFGKLRWSVENVLILLFVIIWAGVLVSIVIVKLSTDTFLSFVEHLTDWNLFANAVYYVLDALAYADSTGMMFFFLLSYGFWIVNGLSWMVFVLVFVMFADNSAVFTDLAKEHGGKYTYGTLLNANALFHYVPGIINIIYMFLRRRELSKALSRFMPGTSKMHPVLSGTIVLIVMLSPGFLVVVYIASFSIKQVYGLTTSPAFLFVLAFIVIIVFNGIPMMLLKLRSDRYLKKLVKKTQELEKATNEQYFIPNSDLSGFDTSGNAVPL